MSDVRRAVPRTDAVLADPALTAASARLGRDVVKAAVRAAQELVRSGALEPAGLVAAVLGALPPEPGGLRPVVNATGVVVHTNLGRAPLGAPVVAALAAAAGPADVEFDLGTGARARRGRETLAALAAAVPDAEAVHVVNNAAAALVLCATVLAGAGREIVVSRGELVEIGDGFRLPDLMVSTGAVLREVGTTNRTALDDYVAAVGPATGFLFKVHPSNFVVTGFTAEVGVADLATTGVPVVADVGSGLLAPDPLLPDEPDVRTALRAGATVVLCSGDKLLGGPQCGLLFGTRDVIERLRRHPLARALRVDKLTLAALHATLTAGGDAGVDDAARRRRGSAGPCGRPRRGRGPGRGGGRGHRRPRRRGRGPGGRTAERGSRPARSGHSRRCGRAEPAVVGYVRDDRCVLDLRTVDPADDDLVRAAVVAVLGG